MFRAEELTPEDLAATRRLAALHRRVALLEMTRHEFLTPDFTRQRTTFADGTTVTVDFKTAHVEITPDTGVQP